MVTAAATSSSSPSSSSHYPSSGEDDNNNNSNNNVNSLSLRQAIDYCLDILKIKKDSSECYRNIIQTTITTTKAPLAIIKTHGNWIAAMKLIADCSGIVNYNSNSNKKHNDDNHYHVFSQTQLYDFLALASKVLENKEGRIDNNNNIILKILRDIMENYENLL
jgi:hypothetical protein